MKHKLCCITGQPKHFSLDADVQSFGSNNAISFLLAYDIQLGTVGHSHKEIPYLAHRLMSTTNVA